MDREELKQMLAENNIHPSCYELDGRPADDASDAYVLEKQSGGWYVYYTERGGRFDEHTFATEDEACRYIFDRLMSTDTTRADVRERHKYREE